MVLGDRKVQQYLLSSKHPSGSGQLQIVRWLNDNGDDIAAVPVVVTA